MLHCILRSVMPFHIMKENPSFVTLLQADLGESLEETLNTVGIIISWNKAIPKKSALGSPASIKKPNIKGPTAAPKSIPE